MIFPIQQFKSWIMGSGQKTEARQSETSAFDEVTNIRGLAKVGGLLVFLFFGVFGLWALVVPLSGAVIAQGAITKGGKTKEISHELGGVIGDILVKEGDKVKAGDVLVILDDVDRRSLRNRLKAQLEALAVLQARLLAEQKGAEAFTIKDLAKQQPLLAHTDFQSPQFKATFDDQLQQFTARQSKRVNDVSVMTIERDTLEQQMVGMRHQLAATDDRVASYHEEIKGQRKLLKKGYGRTSDLLRLERDLAESREEQARLKTETDTLPLRIEGIDRRIQQIQDTFADELTEEIAENRRNIVEVKNQLDAAQNAFSRVEVKAPVAGIIDKVNFNTVGSAVAAFTPIVSMVPDDETVVVEVRVSPTDIDLVKLNQDAQIVLSAFDRNEVLPVEAKTIFISPDSRIDEVRGIPYFAVRLEVSADDVSRLPPIQSGMPVEAYLKTTTRTFAAIMLKPFTDSLKRSFRG